jgi:predicted dithiol-disulfide oxidoreductase (DUF899 family)
LGRRDNIAEARNGTEQVPIVNVFAREGSTIRRFGGRRCYEGRDPGPDQRHADKIGSLWNMFDLLPGGRGSDRYTALRYS